MKKFLLITVFTITAISLWNCEKDDICEDGTPTTPRMIIEFYDNNNPTAKKTVTNLAVVAQDITDTLLFNGVSKIEIPLKTNAENVSFNFVHDSKNEIVSLRNTDGVIANYTHNDVFISRACGYKTVFTLNDPDGLDFTADSDNWIKEIAIQNHNILNENEVHVKIFF